MQQSKADQIINTQKMCAAISPLPVDCCSKCSLHSRIALKAEGMMCLSARFCQIKPLCQKQMKYYNNQKG